MVPLGFVYFFEYLINQGLVSILIIDWLIKICIKSIYTFFQFELVYFENIWLTHAEQYRWYQVLYQLGVFISRTSVNLFPIEKIWILTILQVNIIYIKNKYAFTLKNNIENKHIFTSTYLLILDHDSFLFFTFSFQGFNVVFFLSETVYLFTPSIYIIFSIIVFEGLLGGGAYANSYHNIMKKV